MTAGSFPTLFVPHGAGPCFFMDWNPPGTWDRMEAWLRSVVEVAGAKPREILIVTGHWEEDAFTANAHGSPGMLYDYSGFPEHTYQLKWPAPGSPTLAARVRRLLAEAGLPAAEDRDRGFDHGVFIPMMLAFPDADVPVVQLSLRTGLDPAEHIAAGAALAPLRQDGVLIIGSGMSYHNMGKLMRSLRSGETDVDPDSERFDAWLAAAVALPRAEREEKLARWAAAPGGQASHPREEHLLPLHVVAGAAAEDAGARVFQDRVLGSVQSAFRFGEVSQVQ
ncbi:MAG: DODA-type extradiol aromatic ring-opening family dioxygenase [Steroidobacteraceae bacterium]